MNIVQGTGPWAKELRLAQDVVASCLNCARDFKERPEIHNLKGRNDYSTAVDHAVERLARELLKQSSEYPLQAEEESPNVADATRWVLDPIDGTFNLRNEIPIVAISLCLLVENKPTIGITASLHTEDIFVGCLAHGTFLNGRRCQPTNAPLGESAIALGEYAHGCTPKWSNEFRTRAIEALSKVVGRIRITGTSATDLAWVAGGRVAAGVMFSNTIWDVGAGVALVRAAGGVVTDIRGNEWSPESDSIVAAANRVTLDEMLKTLHSCI